MSLDNMSDSKRILIFINIVVACIASSMMSTALSTALPSIIDDFGITASLAQWLSSGYMLCMAVMIPATAFLVRRFRTRTLYIGVVCVYLAGLVVDILAVNFGMLMLGRVMQACANGVLMSMGQIVLMSVYPVGRHGAVLGWYGLSLTVAPIISPAVSGVLIDAVSWRGVFLIPLVFMSASVVIAAFTLPDILETSGSGFDVLSFSLCALGFGGLTLGVGNVISLGPASPATLVPVVAGVIGAALFVMRQRRLANPFLDLSVFSHRGFTLAVLVGMLFYATVMSMSVLMPLFFQTGMGYSAAMSGVFLLFGSLVVAATSPLSGRWYDRRGVVPVVLFSAVTLAVGSLGLSMVGPSTPVAVPVVLYTVAALAGCQMMPLTAFGINSVPEASRADATSLINALRTLAGALGMALSTGLMELVASGSDGTVMESTMEGMSVTFTVIAVIAVATLLVGLLLRGTGTRADGA
ncbi:MAG: MFS transporter [Candidatus Methanomethylophilaceae archaeon]|nr:MFS transporter [Candidatus Methanomethylophilaceae archaeon]